MRNKVFLINGTYRISKKVTVAEFERINLDHVVVIAALRKPQSLPDGFDLTLSNLESKMDEVLNHWRDTEQEYIVASEYAQIALDHGMNAIKCVEGSSLRTNWLYETVKIFHRLHGHTVVDVFTYCKDGDNMIRIWDVSYTEEEAIERLKPEDWLG